MMTDLSDKDFSLCWDDFNTNFSAGIDDFFNRGDLVDVTLSAEGQQINAHRLVLSLCSPYFRQLFTQTSANQHDLGKCDFFFLKNRFIFN
jgi:hypothetical protein